MVHQWGFFGSISAIRKIWSLIANSRSLRAAALKPYKWFPEWSVVPNTRKVVEQQLQGLWISKFVEKTIAMRTQ